MICNGRCFLEKADMEDITFEVKQKLGLLSRILDYSIKNVTLHPVELTLVWQKLWIDIAEVEEFLLHEDFNYDVDILKEWDWETVIFPDSDCLTVYSIETGNCDSRGGGCGNEKFPIEDFIWTMETPGGITLKHLTEGVYRMKGSKYDYCYELFSGIHYQSEKDKHHVVRAKFDYGS